MNGGQTTGRRTRESIFRTCRRVTPPERLLETPCKSVIYELSGGLGERNTPGTEVGCRGGEQAHR